jgi:hypothetical protein
MRLPDTEHTRQPWRVHDITTDFVLEDVWALPTPGEPDDLARLVRQMASGDDFSGGPAVRALMAVRWRLGALLRWDSPDTGLGVRVPSLRERLPPDLRDGPRGPDLKPVPFTSVYLTSTEWLAETANRTVHALMHIGWVAVPTGGHRGQMAVLVKPNGLIGTTYLAGIKPFRRIIVYPSLMRSIGREWHGR